MKAHAILVLTAISAVFASAPVAAAQPPDAARIEQIAGWLGNGTYSPTPRIDDRAFWISVGRSGRYADVVRLAAESNRSSAALPDDLYLEYSRNGNRSRYEAVYFRKLKAYRVLVIAECVENKGRFLEPIQQAIASYVADKTWVLPAHDSGLENFEGRNITIDLFSSEIACDLATTDHLLGQRLSEATRTLLRKEVRRRVYDPYEHAVKEGGSRIGWITTTNNWNAVCLANVTGAALALLDRREERAFYVASAEKHIASFLSGFTTDGYCSEGVGYWNYGFGCFVRLGHMLDEATSGNVNLFAMPKAMNAGLFARRMNITPGQYPAFADCTVGSQPEPLIMSYVTRRYKLPPTAEELRLSAPTRWLDELGVFSFAFAAQPDGAETYEPGLRDWFDEAQILICRGVRTGQGLPFGVALKGGHNAEHHNHNDVGSYVVCVGKSMPLVDPGAEVYTRRTFSGQRYVSGVLNSFGHPVPRVAGQLQRTGRAAAAKVLAIDLTDDTDTVTFDLAAPYPVKSLKSLKRTFTFSRVSGELTVKDEVAFDGPESFGTAIITQDGWEQIAENRLRVGSGDEAVIVDIDAGAHPLTITPTAIEEEVRGGLKPVRIGIDLKEPVREATIRVKVSPAK